MRILPINNFEKEWLNALNTAWNHKTEYNRSSNGFFISYVQLRTQTSSQALLTRDQRVGKNNRGGERNTFMFFSSRQTNL